MAATETDSVQDHMTRLRMKMVQQKIQNEKDRINQRPPSEESNSNDMEQQARLQQAMLRRQELLDKIRREQLLNDEGRRPRTDSPRRRYTPSPVPIPPSRRSMPEFARYNVYNQMPNTYRGGGDMSQVKHVIEHKIATPRPHVLPPIKQAPPPVIQQQPPVVVHPPPAPYVMQSQVPQVIQGPPQHIIQQVPNPVIQNLGPPERQTMFNKAEFGEMMMFQNAQMHQLVMERWLMKDLGMGGDLGGKQSSGKGCGKRSSCSRHSHHSNHGCHGHGHGCGCGSCVAVLPPVMPRAGGGVHHHHYTSPPPSQPAVHHYQTMPPMNIRGGYPMGGYSSMYEGPGYAYGGYDGDNYYTYH